MSDVALPDQHDISRWLLSAAIVLTAHATFAAAILQWHEPVEPNDPSAAIVINLAPMPVAPAEVPTEIPPGPEQIEAQATPVQEVKPDEQKLEEVPAAPNPEIVLSQIVPKEEPTPQDSQPPAPVTTAPQVPSAAIAPVAAAPTQGQVHLSDSNAVPSWKRQVVGILERNKRYPPTARARNEQGTAQIAFSLNREGRVVSSRIVKSSGSSTLDVESLELVKRAEPFPPPPPELTGALISLTVPVRFNIR
jgi:protein TonB